MGGNEEWEHEGSKRLSWGRDRGESIKRDILTEGAIMGLRINLVF